MLGDTLRTWLAHPLTRGLSVDDPRTTALRRQIVEGNVFLRQIYEEWYAAIARALPPGREPVLELGSGAGFMRDVVPHLIGSEVFMCEGIDAVVDASHLPFRDASLRAIVMTDVFHHIPRPRCFFAEMTRCVRPGGAVVMIEPWVSAWSTFIYRRFHHEPFRPDTADWEFPASGPLSGANGALPWVVFARDRDRFEREFPQWRIDAIAPCLPFRYLVSGGVSMRRVMPAASQWAWKWIENRLEPWMDRWAMFARIVLIRRDDVSLRA